MGNEYMVQCMIKICNVCSTTRVEGCDFDFTVRGGRPPLHRAQSLVASPDESCGIVQLIVTDFDDTYFAGASIQSGCGFEMQNTGLAVFVNIDTKFADICPETCLVVPSTCSNATNATAAA